MSILSALQRATTLRELAPLLGLPPSALAYTLYKIPQSVKYSTFTIPKRSGGERTIKAPIERLKDLQSALASVLTKCRQEIEAKRPQKVISHGFRSGASIQTNASQHRSRRYVLNLDLENFFPTINFGRVRGYFAKNRDFELNETVATILAQIACDGESLPQGSPCSPIISELVAHLLDVHMVQFARKHKCTYSRYADDLTFSTNREQFPEKIAYQLEEGNSAWVLGGELLGLINRAGFAVNHHKTRMQYRGSRQIVTGLTVNRKVNVPTDYYRSARLMCGALFATGSFHLHHARPDATGHVPSGTIEQLEGILNYVYYTKNYEVLRATKASSAPVQKVQLDRQQGITKLYHKFLFFKKFVIANKPFLICEGQTDKIYLDAAIRHLPGFAGVLFDDVGGKRHSRIQYLNYSALVREVMGLGGGTGHFPGFIYRYGPMVARYKYAPLTQPVILLIDNDDGAKGAKSVFGAVKHVTISHTTTAPFYRIARNLYLVKTPELGLTGFSKIEDFFKPAVLGTIVDGRRFNASNDYDPSTEYGKQTFAERVVAPGASTINFSDFVPLLDRIASVIVYHAGLVASGTV